MPGWSISADFVQVIPYAEPEKEKEDASATATLAQTMPMAAASRSYPVNGYY